MSSKVVNSENGKLDSARKEVITVNAKGNATMSKGKKSKKNQVKALQTEKIEEHYAIIRQSMNEYTQYARTATAAYLHTAQCVYEASEALETPSYKVLASKFGSAASLSRYLTVGKKVGHMKIHIDALPSSNTAVYHLARLEPDAFDGFIATKQINALMTNADAAALLPDSPSSAAENLFSVIVKSDEKTKQIQREHRDNVSVLLQRIKDAAVELKKLGACVRINELTVAASV